MNVLFLSAYMQYTDIMLNTFEVFCDFKVYSATTTHHPHNGHIINEALSFHYDSATVAIICRWY